MYQLVWTDRHAGKRYRSAAWTWLDLLTYQLAFYHLHMALEVRLTTPRRNHWTSVFHLCGSDRSESGCDMSCTLVAYMVPNFFLHAGALFWLLALAQFAAQASRRGNWGSLHLGRKASRIGQDGSFQERIWRTTPTVLGGRPSYGSVSLRVSAGHHQGRTPRSAYERLRWSCRWACADCWGTALIGTLAIWWPSAPNEGDRNPVLCTCLARKNALSLN